MSARRGVTYGQELLHLPLLETLLEQGFFLLVQAVEDRWVYVSKFGLVAGGATQSLTGGGKRTRPSCLPV